MGGSGWEVELFDGTTEKYYVELPSDVAIVKQVFGELKLPDSHEFAGKSIEDVSEYYVEVLQAVIDSAKSEFAPDLVTQNKELKVKKLPPYLRVVK